MGKRGPEKTPEAINELRGHPGKRAQRRSARFPDGNCACPDWLGEVGRKKWREMLEIVSPVNGLMKPAFTDALALYCEAFEEFMEARAQIEKLGATAFSVKGGVYQHPEVGRKNKAIQRMRQFGALFGLNPVSESDLVLSGSPDKEQGDPLLTLLRSRSSN